MYTECSMKLIKCGLLKEKNDLRIIFYTLFHSLGNTFYKSSKDTNNSMSKAVEEKYRGDGLLFEWSCYIIFKIQDWLTDELSNEIREDILLEITTYLNANAIRGFAKAFKKETPYILEIWQERQEYFSLLKDALSTSEVYHHELKNLINLSKHGATPQHLDRKKEHDPIPDFESTTLSMALASWEASVLPTLLTHIKKTALTMQAVQRQRKGTSFKCY